MNTNAQKNQMARINRQLGQNSERVLSSRSEKERQYLGDFYTLDSYQNAVIDTHVNLNDFEAELAKKKHDAAPQQRSLNESRQEGLTMRLIEQFLASIYPDAWEFSEDEIDCIASWAGMDDKGTFSPDDEKLITAYKLNIAAGENTYPRFAEILRSRKAKWDEQYRAEANLRHGEKLLGAAVHECVLAGMSRDAIFQQAGEFLHLSGR